MSIPESPHVYRFQGRFQGRRVLRSIQVRKNTVTFTVFFLGLVSSTFHSLAESVELCQDLLYRLEVRVRYFLSLNRPFVLNQITVAFELVKVGHVLFSSLLGSSTSRSGDSLNTR